MRAKKATEEGAFRDEIVPVRLSKSEAINDEPVVRADPGKIPLLKPAFRDGGTVTAANSSGISDGAAALVLMSAAEAERRGLRPLARVSGHASHAQAPAWFTTAPVGAIEKLLQKLGWKKSEVDLFEINEAFAVVAEKYIRDLKLDRDKVNVNGGSIALGHPIGATGSVLIGTLLDELERRDLRRGLVTMCAAGGMAPAIIIERV